MTTAEALAVLGITEDDLMTAHAAIEDALTIGGLKPSAVRAWRAASRRFLAAFEKEESNP